MNRFFRKSNTICLTACVIFLSIFTAPAPADVTYHLDTWGMPDYIQNELTWMMNDAVAAYNKYGSFNKHLTIKYHESVPTAQGGGNEITFGGSRNSRVAMHEISHTMGTGTYGPWWGMFSGGVCISPYTTSKIQEMDGPGARLYGDNWHYWPYGLNYDSEDGYFVRMKHVQIVAAQVADMGYVAFVQEPKSMSVAPGDTAVISTRASHTSTYRWFKQGNPNEIQNGGDISGAQTDTLTIRNMDINDEGYYFCHAGPQDSRPMHLTMKRFMADWTFDNTLLDNQGEFNATSSGGASYTTGKVGKAINLDGENDHIILPKGILDTDEFTIATWVYWRGGNDWQRIFDFGTAREQCVFLTPKAGSKMFFTIKNYGFDQNIEVDALPTNQWVHVAVTLRKNKAALYVNGRIAGTNNNMTFNPADFKPHINFIGRSLWPDPYLNGMIDEFKLYTYAIPGSEIWALSGGTPGEIPTFTQDPVIAPNATEGSEYLDNLSNYIEYDGQEELTFSKISGPSWLTIESDGAMFGTPDVEVAGINSEFLVNVKDESGGSDDTTIIVYVESINDAPAWHVDDYISHQTAKGQSVLIDLNDYASDSDVGDTLTFTKTDGPDWITVTPEGFLQANPDDSNIGITDISLSVSDAQNKSDQTKLKLIVGNAAAIYKFNNNTLDSVFQNHATLHGSASYATGKEGQCFKLDGSEDYMQLPSNIADSNDITITAWVVWSPQNSWQRIFDFGNSTSQCIMLTPNDGGDHMKFVIKDTEIGEQSLLAPKLPIAQWVHVAVTLIDDTGYIYVNGQLQTSGPMTIDPSDFRPRKNYIAASQYPDPLFGGRIDDFRVYNFGMTNQQILDIYNFSPVTSGQPVFAEETITKKVTYQLPLTNQSVKDSALSPDGDALSFQKLDGPDWLTIANDGTMTGTPQVEDLGINEFTIEVTDSKSQTATTTLKIIVETETLKAHYRFENNLKNATQNNRATAFGNPIFAKGKVFKGMYFNGNDYLSIPAGSINTDNLTVAAWVYWKGGNNWQRIFDFGKDTSEYIGLIPNSGDNTLRFVIKDGTEQYVDYTKLPLNQWVHVAVTLDGSTAKIYYNGILKATNDSITHRPTNISLTKNYIGKSLWPDPLLNGNIDDFRIYNYALSLQEIQNLAKTQMGFDELTAIAQWWLTQPIDCKDNPDCSTADINSDNKVDLIDLSEMIYRW